MEVCPKGHESTESDYCSECGAKMAGAAVAAAGGASAVGGEVCPDCGTVREQAGVVFCEVCGYNFATGAHGEVGVVPVAVSEPVVVVPVGWAVEVWVDGAGRLAESPEAPVGFVGYRVELAGAVSLVGRGDAARGIVPEVALGMDEAVSRRHALLQRDAAGGLTVRDVGSANGTRVNGVAVEAMTDVPLKVGDEIAVGHWTRLTVRAGA